MRRSLAVVGAAATLAVVVAGCGTHPSRQSGAAGPVSGSSGTTSPGASPATGGSTAPSTSDGPDGGGAPSDGGGSTQDPTPTTDAPTGEPPTDSTSDSPGATPTPAPTTSTGNLSQARAYISGRGYDPESAHWDYHHELNAIVGVLHTSGDGHYQRAFFFVDGHPIGTDTADPSAGISVVDSSTDTVTLSYALYGPDASYASPTTYANVRFQWTGSKLVPLDAIPPAQSSSQPSRN